MSAFPFETNSFIIIRFQDPKSKWQKVEYLAEFAEWLFINEFPIQDSLDHVYISFHSLA